MIVKKAGGKVIGGQLTVAEKKALRIELLKEQAEINRQNWTEIDAIFLWWLHEKLGFGPKRLKEFYQDFGPAFRELNERYEMGEEESPWLCTHKLKEIGVNLEEWAKENKPDN